MQCSDRRKRLLNGRKGSRNRVVILLFTLATAFGQGQRANADATVSVFADAGAGVGRRDEMTVKQGEATAQVAGGGAFGNNQSHLFQINAFGSGDTGRIGVATQQTTIGWNGTGSAFGKIFDTLTFSGPRPDDVEFSLSLIGGFYNTGNPSSFFAEAVLSMGAFEASSLQVSWDSSFGSPVRYNPRGDVTLLGASDEPQLVQGTLRVRGRVNPGDAVDIFSQLLLRTQPGYTGATANALFDQTAELRITLPEGWSFTSASGTFLTQQGVTAAPEPGTLALLALALPVMGLVRRRAFHAA